MPEESKAPSNEDLLKIIMSLKSDAEAPLPVADGWKKTAPDSACEIKSVSIPISLMTPDGKIRVYLTVDGSAAANADTLMSTIESLAAKGLPLDLWKPKGDYNKKRSW